MMVWSSFKKWLKVGCYALLCVHLQSEGVVRLQIGSPSFSPFPIGIEDFHGEEEEMRTIGREISSIVRGNLLKTGFFHHPPLEQAESSLQIPDYALLEEKGFQVLATGTVTQAAGSEIIVLFRLWDIFSKSQLKAYRFKGTTRLVAHRISDMIYEELTGLKGDFSTTIAFIAETKKAKRTIKRLALMDQDGHNIRYLTDGSFLVLTPQFAPNGYLLSYFSYKNKVPQVVILNLETRKETVLEAQGMTFAPRFSPDSNRIAFALEKEGNSDLYLTSLDTGKQHRLTRHFGIDTSPSFNPSGEYLVFNSDRSGAPQLYVMHIKEGRSKRITFRQGHYLAPTWSPRGDLIAFTKRKEGAFHLGVMRPDGTGERLLTSGHLDDTPTFSPNGQVLLFSRLVGKSYHLFSIDISGRFLRKHTLPHEASDPTWSPRKVGTSPSSSRGNP